MPKSVIEGHPQLWHYTTAIGLHGIITSQQLWATDILYLNDKDEFTSFFDHKLPSILSSAIQEGITEGKKSLEGRKSIESLGGEEKVKNTLHDFLLRSFRDITLQYQVYITSFCSPETNCSEDGILSQWRGYGLDGGYAIVFDTKKLNELLVKENETFFYSFSHWGDVDYHDENTVAENPHDERLQWETDIRQTVAKCILEGDINSIDELFQPILILATRHKHRGFNEESEVRIACITSTNDNVPDDARATGDHRLKKTVCFTPKNGILIPYIALFSPPDDKAQPLPIKKIIVGPHPEKLKRKNSIEKLLRQHEIEAEVVTSSIPYLGR